MKALKRKTLRKVKKAYIKTVDWKDVVKQAEKEAENYYNKYFEPLTLRGLFYILVSKNIIPNTKSAYKKLSLHLAKARYEGRFPWYLIKDITRPTYYLERETWLPPPQEKLAEMIEKYIENLFTVSINPWEDQEKKVIVVLEKEALSDIVKKFIKEVFPYGVYQLKVIRGYDSATDIKQLADVIKSIREEGKKPVILILSDFDPSGEDIVRDFIKRVSALAGTQDIVFEKIAVTPKQIVELKLPPKPESVEELEKLRRDPRFKKYVEKLKNVSHFKRLLSERLVPRVELDALVSLKPEEFKKILKKTLEKYFNKSVYLKVTLKKEKEIKKEAEKQRKEIVEKIKKTLMFK